MVYQGQKTHTVKLFATKVTQPSGAAAPEEADTRHRRASASSDFSLPKCGGSKMLQAVTRTEPSVSACESLCAILLRKASVYPLSLVKANVGRLCEKLKNAMRSGLEQRCDGNFWTIFAGTILGEKPNFTGRFSEW